MNKLLEATGVIHYEMYLSSVKATEDLMPICYFWYSHASNGVFKKMTCIGKSPHTDVTCTACIGDLRYYDER